MSRQGKRLPGFLLGLLGLSLLLASPASADLEPEKYALESIGVSLSTPQAGAHADLTVDFQLTANNNEPYALTLDVIVSMPPGVIGNPQGFPRCS